MIVVRQMGRLGLQRHNLQLRLQNVRKRKICYILACRIEFIGNQKAVAELSKRQHNLTSRLAAKGYILTRLEVIDETSKGA